MKYRIYAHSEKSAEAGHMVNEDSCMFTEFSFMKDKKIKLMVIADGMGGLSDGDKASKRAVRGFVQTFYGYVMQSYIHTTMDHFSLRYALCDIEAAMREAIRQANLDVCREADPFAPTGTTISAVCIIDDCAVVANVGDSPVYLYRKQSHTLRRVSTLQTKAERDVMAGAYAPYSGDYYANSHILSVSLGQYTDLKKEDICVQAIGELKAGDVILAGSDGSFGYLKEQMLLSLIDDCTEDEEGFILTQLFDMARMDLEDDRTALMYVSA